MREFLRLDGFRAFMALVAALAVVSLGVSVDVAQADEPGGEDVVVPAPAPARAAPPPAPAPADEDDFHLYVSGNVAGGFAKGRSSGSINGTANSGSDRDEDVFGGGSLGLHYDASPVGVRVELEGQAARGLDLNTNVGPLGAFTLHTNTNTWAMFGNVWLDFPLTDALSIFGGGGMGVAITDITSVVNGVGDKSRDDTTWAWQTGGGISFAATDWLTLDTSYRFVDLGEPDLKFRIAPFPSDNEMHLQSHDVMLGVRVNFFSF